MLLWPMIASLDAGQLIREVLLVDIQRGSFLVALATHRILEAKATLIHHHSVYVPPGRHVA